MAAGARRGVGQCLRDIADSVPWASGPTRPTIFPDTLRRVLFGTRRSSFTARTHRGDHEHIIQYSACHVCRVRPPAPRTRFADACAAEGPRGDRKNHGAARSGACGLQIGISRDARGGRRDRWSGVEAGKGFADSATSARGGACAGGRTPHPGRPGTARRTACTLGRDLTQGLPLG